MGGLLYISLSSGRFWIKCHLLIKMFLRFGKAGWYVLTKGRILFRTSLFFSIKSRLQFSKFKLRGDFFCEIVRVTSSAKASFKVVDVLIERFGWGVGSQKSKDFACFTYHPALPNLKNILMSKWHLIQNQPLLREIYNEPPIISYKRAKPLGDTCILVRTKL